MKRVMSLLTLAVLLLGTPVAWAAHFWNSPDGAWCEPANWWDGAGATLPSAGDTVYIDSPVDSGRICRVPADCNAVASILYGPAYGPNTDATLIIEPGGTLDIGGNWQMANNGFTSIGTVEMNGGAVTVGGTLSIAYFGEGLFDMNGGTVDIGGWLEVPWNSQGKALLRLDGGVMTAERIGELRGNGLYDDGVCVDITEGTLVLHDKTQMSYWIGYWASQGKIVAYGGAGELVIDTTGDDVIVSASLEPVPTTYYWNKDPNGVWCTAENWFNQAGRSEPPRLIDTVYIDGNRICEINPGCAAQAAELLGPAYSAGWNATLAMTGGSLEVAGDMQMAGEDGTSIATFDLSGGAATIGGEFSLAYFGDGTLNMTGGSLTVAGNIQAPWHEAGAAMINLNGGTVEANSLQVRGTDVVMDITEGVMVLNGDQRFWLAAGGPWADQVTAYGGHPEARVRVTYDSATDKTTLVAEPLAGDLNGDCTVNGTDLAELAGNWLDPWTLADFAAVAGHWMQSGTLCAP